MSDSKRIQILDWLIQAMIDGAIQKDSALVEEWNALCRKRGKC